MVGMAIMTVGLDLVTLAALLSIPDSNAWTSSSLPTARTPYPPTILSTPTTSSSIQLTLANNHELKRHTRRRVVSRAVPSSFASKNDDGHDENNSGRHQRRIEKGAEKEVGNTNLKKKKKKGNVVKRTTITSGSNLSKKGNSKVNKDDDANKAKAFLTKRKQQTKKKSSNKSKKAASTRTRSNADGNIYIQFSRVFQRHVVYQSQAVANTNGNTAADKAVVLQSFLFLDDAVKAFPEARVVAPKDLPFPPPSCSLVYPDEEDNNISTVGSGSSSKRLLVSRGRLIDSDVEEEECGTTIAGMGLWTLCELEYDTNSPSHHANTDKDYQHKEAHAALRKLLELVSSKSAGFDTVPRHFFRLDHRRFAMRGHTPESIALNHARVVNLLSCGGEGTNGSMSSTILGEESEARTIGLAMDPFDVAFVLQNFPQLCLYNCDELEDLVQFLLQPLPAEGSIPSVSMVADRGDGGANVDWPSLSGRGYGAGLSIDQATKAIRMMPELLALYFEDSRKPSIMYLYNQMQTAVPPKLIDEANVRLNLLEGGNDPSDAYTFAYLRSLGITWGQLRILISSLPLWTTCHLEPGWELLQKGPVRSMLKRPSLDYLRQRLQIGPGDTFRMLKTHTRLSTYDACNKILPTLDNLQSQLDLSSAELRKLILRMPSLVGMGNSAFVDRLDFFTNEVGMSIDDAKQAVMKQPSLLQYGISSTLRPKLNFFLEELGLSTSSVSRIVRLAPAVMGLSLTENLRPKVASLMRTCSLNPFEVGHIISTSPQTLLLSQKSKIEPTLAFLSSELMINEERELGQIVLKAPRVLLHGLETSLAKKFEMLANDKTQQSKEATAAIFRGNPALLVTSNAVLEDRIERCPEDMGITTWLLPSARGRRKNIEQTETNLDGDAILASSDDSFQSLTKIYLSTSSAAEELEITKSAVHEACRNKMPVDGNYLTSLTEAPTFMPPNETTNNNSMPSLMKKVSISIFCSGGVYPSDNSDMARGQARTGGLAIQVFTDCSGMEKANFLQEFSRAAESCFGIRLPPGKEDGGSLIAVFPLVNPSTRRCELFSCSGALKILEEFMKMKKNKKEIWYDVNVYTNSNYAWRFVRSKEKLINLGSHFTSQEMLSHLDMPSYSVNIDILHPLARSFSRLNSHEEPLESAHQPFDNTNVQFLHSMDNVPLNEGGLRYLKRLKQLAKSAAMWQFHRERNIA